MAVRTEKNCYYFNKNIIAAIEEDGEDAKTVQSSAEKMHSSSNLFTKVTYRDIDISDKRAIK